VKGLRGTGRWIGGLLVDILCFVEFVLQCPSLGCSRGGEEGCLVERIARLVVGDTDLHVPWMAELARLFACLLE